MQSEAHKKLEELYQEFREDEFKEKGIHNPAHFVDTQPFLYRSKELGFISRLVRKDKVNLSKIKTIRYRYIESDERGQKESFSMYEYDECLIMMLSIEDEPMEFLLSILK